MTETNTTYEVVDEAGMVRQQLATEQNANHYLDGTRRINADAWGWRIVKVDTTRTTLTDPSPMVSLPLGVVEKLLADHKAGDRDTCRIDALSDRRALRQKVHIAVSYAKRDAKQATKNPPAVDGEPSDPDNLDVSRAELHGGKVQYGVPWCYAPRPKGWYSCTRLAGHDGDHVAHGLPDLPARARWAQEAQS